MSLSNNKKGIAGLIGGLILFAGGVQAFNYLARVFEEKGWPPMTEFAALKTEVRCLKLNERLPGLRRWAARAEEGTENWQKARDTLESVEAEWDQFKCPQVLIQ